MSYNPYSPPSGYETEEKSVGQVWVSQDSVALRRVSLGLSLMFYAIMLVVMLSFLGGFAGAVLGAQAGKKASEVVPKHPLIMAVGIGGALCGLMSLVGQCLCLNVPEESNAKGYILTAVVAQMFGLGLNGMSTALQFTGHPPNPLIDVIAGLVGGLAVIVFMLFLKGLAKFIRRDDLAQRAQKVLLQGVLVYGLLMFVGAVMVFSLLTMKPEEMLPLILGAGCMAMFLGIYTIVVLVQYILLLGAMSTAVSPA